MLIRTLLLALTGASLVQAQSFDRKRGADPAVDYAALARIAPWDDRNYALTSKDLALLADNEAELALKVPLFYRVELRRQLPNLLREGRVQYPHSAYPKFILKYGGFLVDGIHYRSLRRAPDGHWQVNPASALPPAGKAAQALDGEARVTNPNGAAESAIAMHPTNPELVIAGSNGPNFGQDMHYSSDGGVTWTHAPNLPLGNTCCDPTVAWSSDGSKAYAASLGANPSDPVYVYRSADNGQTWTDLSTEAGADPRREIGSSTDKEYLHVDTHPSSPYKDHVYLTWHESNVMKFARSTDRAHTWSAPLTISSGTAERGIGSDITSDASGRVYYVWPAFNSKTLRLRRSSDGGATFEASSSAIASTQASFSFPVPSMEAREVFVYAAAAADHGNGPHAGSVYVAWTDSTAATSTTAANNHARIQVAYSRNGGDSWTVTTPHETADAASVDRFHPWLGVAADGSVHVVYYDTRNAAARDSVDLYWSKSTDGAQTWSTPQRLTTVLSPNIVDSFEFGDYNGLDVVGTRLLAIYTDNRAETGSGDSVDVYAIGRSTVDANLLFGDGFE